MSDEYQLRRDIDRVINLISDLDEIVKRTGVNSLEDLLGLYPDVSELETLSAHLNRFKESIINYFHLSFRY